MEQLTYIDIAVIAVVGISTIVAFFRGLITEVLSLFVWIAAFWGAATFYQDVANILPSLFQNYAEGKFDFTSDGGATETLLITILSFAITFLVILFCAGLVNLAVSLILRRLKISWPDRLLGMFFGFLRGWLIITFVGVFVVNTNISSIPMWQNSKTTGAITNSVQILKKLLPKKFLNQININEISKLLQSDLQAPNENSQKTRESDRPIPVKPAA